MKEILVVDDMKGIRDSLSAVLQGEGYKVTTCNNGLKAQGELSRNTYDLIITDILMPKGDGIDLMRYVQERNLAVPVLAISGGGPTVSSTQALEAIKEMATGALQKPFSKDELLSAVNSALN